MIVKLCTVADLPAPGTLRAVAGRGHELCLAVVAGVPFAVGNRCPHAGAPLSAGRLEDGVLVCPLHGWRFRLRDGLAEHPGDPPLRTFELRTFENDVFIRLPQPDPPA